MKNQNNQGDSCMWLKTLASQRKTHSWGVGHINTGVLTMRNIAQKKGVMQ